MKNSSATSAKATGRPRPSGPSSGSRPSPTTADFALSGPSDPPDPNFNAYRKDLADIALAGRVIASHYAAPVKRRLQRAAELRSGASADCSAICTLAEGAPFELLDDSLGWAWGYGGEERKVGYVESVALAAKP